MDAKKVGKQIQRARTARGITQADLAQLVDLTPKYLSNIECGSKSPRLETFIAIANALGSDANSLLVDVLDVSTSVTSSTISQKLATLPVGEQRRLMRILDVMIDEATKKE